MRFQSLFATKRRRWISGIAGGLILLPVIVFLLRWPLFGGAVKSKIRQIVATQLGGDVEIGTLGGSLLHGVNAFNIHLEPGPGSPIRSADVDRISVAYGIFGSKDPDIDVGGARIKLGPSSGPAKSPIETIRDLPWILGSIRFTGSVRIHASKVTLADGTEIVIDDASIHGASVTARVHLPAFGEVTACMATDASGKFSAEAKATAGPVPWVRIEFDAGSTKRALRISTVVEGRTLSLVGDATFSDKRLERVTGTVRGDEGTLVADVDLASGHSRIDGAIALELRKEITGRIALNGKAEGPITGPLDRWTFDGVKVKGERLAWKTLRADQMSVECDHAERLQFPLRVSFRNETDQVDAAGLFSPADPIDIDTTFKVNVRELEPYLAVLKSPPNLKAAKVRAEGRLTLGARGPSFTGSVAADVGRVGPVSWDTLAATADWKPHRLGITRLLVTGIAQLRGDLSARGVLREENGRWTFEDMTVKAGTLFQSDDVDAVFTTAPDAWSLEMPEGNWTIAGRSVDHGPITLVGLAKRIELSEAHLGMEDVHVALKGWVELGDRVRLLIEGNHTDVGGVKLAAFVIEGDLNSTWSEGTARFAWGTSEGDHLNVDARLDDKLDVRVGARIRDLSTPLLKRLYLLPDLRGSIMIDAKVRGTLDAPDPSGSIQLAGVSIGGGAAFDFALSFDTADRILVIPPTQLKTPIGVLSLRGRLPLPGATKGEPVDATAKLDLKLPKALLDLLPSTPRSWIPPATGTILVNLRGPIGKPVWEASAHLAVDRHVFPRPLGTLTALTLDASLDSKGLRIAALDAKLGEGPFHIEGTWDLWSADRPIALSLTGREMLALSDVPIRVRVTPNLKITRSDKNHTRIEGRIEVPLALYFHEFGDGGGSSASHDEKGALALGFPQPRAPTGGILLPGVRGGEELTFNVKIVTTGECRIENSMLGALVEGSLDLGGTLAAPALTGWAKVKKGEIRLTTGLFIRIVSGELGIPAEPGTEPSVTFEGRIGTGDTAITMLVTGPLSRPSVNLRSNPPHTQGELLAMVAFGRLPGTMQRSDAIAVLTTKLLEQYNDKWPRPEEDKGLLRRIEVKLVEQSGEAATRAPWELPIQGTAKGTMIRTEYRLSPHFSILGESDREANVSGDLQLRIRFRF